MQRQRKLLLFASNLNNTKPTYRIQDEIITNKYMYPITREMNRGQKMLIANIPALYEGLCQSVHLKPQTEGF